MFVRSSHKSAGEAQYSVLLQIYIYIYIAVPLSVRFADARLLHISTTVTFLVCDVILAAVASRSLKVVLLLLQSITTFGTVKHYLVNEIRKIRRNTLGLEL